MTLYSIFTACLSYVRGAFGLARSGGPASGACEPGVGAGPPAAAPPQDGETQAPVVPDARMPSPPAFLRNNPQPEPEPVAPRAAAADDAGLAPAQTALAPATDPEREALEAKRAKLESQLAELSARRAEMAERVARFELAQYQALGGVVEECLRLRHRLMQLQAACSGAAEDRAAEAAAEAEFRAYRHACEEAAARPELSEAGQEELKRMYRAAAMACHPDRVEEPRRDAAHALFLRLQQAYRQGDLAALRALQGEIAGKLAGGEEVAAEDAAALKSRVRRLQDQVADLILAIQTLQLDPNYRQAARPEEWEPFFATVRARFEDECDALRRRIRALEDVA